MSTATRVGAEGGGCRAVRGGGQGHGREGPDLVQWVLQIQSPWRSENGAAAVIDATFRPRSPKARWQRTAFNLRESIVSSVRPAGCVRCSVSTRTKREAPSPSHRVHRALQRQLRGFAAPAFVIAFARASGVGDRGDLDPNLELAVALDGGLLGTAIFLAPYQGKFVTEIDVRVDHAQRQPAALVVAVAAEHRKANRLACP